MEWLLDRFGPRTTKLQPFEATRALGTMTAAKAPRGSVGWSSKTKVCLKSPLEGQLRGAAKNSKEYYRRRVVSLSTPKSPDVTQRSLGVVWLVLRPHHGDSHTQGSRYGGRATKDG